jgi:hypothetical protein
MVRVPRIVFVHRACVSLETAADGQAESQRPGYDYHLTNPYEISMTWRSSPINPGYALLPAVRLPLCHPSPGVRGGLPNVAHHRSYAITAD